MFSKIPLLVAAIAVTLSVASATAVSAAALTETESNDTKETADRISSGDSFSGLLPDQTDTDFIMFETPADGLAHIDLNNLPGSKRWLTIYDANGTLLEAGDGDRSSTAVGDTRWTIGLKKGIYYININSYSQTGPTDYTVKYLFEKNTFFEGESNNTFETANPIKLGATYKGNLLPFIDPADVFKIDLDKNGELTIAMAQHLDAEWRFALYDDNGIYIGQMETNKDVKTNKTMSFTSRLKKGSYYIEVKSYDPWAPDYTLSTSFKASEFFEKEPNNTLDVATDLPINQTMRGQFFNDSDTADYFKFTIEKAGKYRLTQKEDFYTEWDLYLYDANLNRIGWKSTESLGVYQAINYVDLEQYLQPGTYYVEMQPDMWRVSWVDYHLTLTSVENPPFKDVPIGHPYFNEIHLMKSKEIILGHTDGSYKPADSLLRHHAALIIERSGVDLTPIRAGVNFTDVPKSHPSYNSIQKLYRAGIIDGANGKFDPNGTLTREQMAKILVNAFNLQKKTGSSLTFSDVPSSRWSYSYVNILASHGITIGYNGKFMPADKLTREHYAVFLSRVWVNN